MKLPAYPRYKPSGVEWLGDVPEHWEVKRLDFLASVKARLGWKGLTASEYVPEGFIFLATPNIKGEGEIDFTNVNYITAERYYESPEIMVQVGDVLMAKDGSTLGTTNVVRHLPAPTTVNSSVAVLRPKASLDSSYFFRWLTSAYLQSVIHSMKDGQGVPHLFQADIRKFSVLLPPLPEQRAIAIFLDRETGRVDRLVAKKRELIKRLKEKRAALISRTVTRGLPPAAARAAGLPENPPLKSSGLDWLGDIPKHWEVKRLRRVVRNIEQGWSPECSNALASTDEWGVVKAGCCNGGRFHTDENKALPSGLDPPRSLEIKVGDLLMSRASGSEDLIGSVALVPSGTRRQLLLSDKTYRLHCDETVVESSFLARVLQSPIGRSQIQAVISGAFGLAKNITQSDVRDFALAVPSLLEQTAIAAYLDAETAKLDALVGKVEEAVERLQEYRTALITAAVTGKIDVRKANIP